MPVTNRYVAGQSFGTDQPASLPTFPLDGRPESQPRGGAHHRRAGWQTAHHELIALRWMDVDWLSQRVRVRRNFVRGEFGTPKSKRSTRSIPLADVLAGELDRQYPCLAYTADEDLVFAHPHTGRPLDRSRLLKRFKAALGRAGGAVPRSTAYGRAGRADAYAAGVDRPSDTPAFEIGTGWYPTARQRASTLWPKPSISRWFTRGERWDSNPRPPGPQPGALPAELRPPWML